MSWVPIITTVIAICVALLTSGVHGLLYVELLTLNGPAGFWELGPIRFDLTDIAFGAIFVGLVAIQPSWQEIRRIPHLGLWVLLGVLISISYLAAPINQAHIDFGAPHEVAYQLYRYAWRQILFYPLVLLLLSKPDRIRNAMIWMVLSGGALALQAIPQGYLGNFARAGGPLDSANALGGALAPALVLCAGFFIAPETRRVRAMGLICALLIIRAMTFSGSRGALLAAGLGGLALLVPLGTLPAVRRHVGQTIAVGFAGAVLLFTVYPTVLTDAPSLARFRGEDGEYSESTLDWRMRERWPHFTKLALESPLLGSGIISDPTLGERGATPHNSYLAIAVLYGFPVTLLMLLFAGFAFWATFRMWFSARPPPLQFLVAVAAASLLTLMLHNMIESMFLSTFGVRYFWSLVAICIGLERATLSAGSSSDSSTNEMVSAVAKSAGHPYGGQSVSGWRGQPG